MVQDALDVHLDHKPPRDRRSIWVPIGAFATAGVLIGGLVSFKRGNTALSQKMMRARVLMQGATVILMIGTVYGVDAWERYKEKKERESA